MTNFDTFEASSSCPMHNGPDKLLNVLKQCRHMQQEEDAVFTKDNRRRWNHVGGTGYTECCMPLFICCDCFVVGITSLCFYYGVTFDAKTQKNLCEKFDSEVLTYNQQRIFLLLPNVCVVRRFFIYILYSSLCVCYGNESMDN